MYSYYYLILIVNIYSVNIVQCSLFLYQYPLYLINQIFLIKLLILCILLLLKLLMPMLKGMSYSPQNLMLMVYFNICLYFYSRENAFGLIWQMPLKLIQNVIYFFILIYLVITLKFMLAINRSLLIMLLVNHQILHLIYSIY